MNGNAKIVDGFKFMPRSLKAFISKSIPDAEYSGDIPWTPMKKAVKEATFALLTSAGISMKTDPAFNMEREKAEPLWGDPSFRMIGSTATEADITINHLHVNTRYVKEDINVVLPLQRFLEFEQEGVIGKFAPTSYSIYGYQMDPTALMESTMPAIAAHMKEEGVDAAVLTPT